MKINKRLVEDLIVKDGDACTYLSAVYCPQCQSMDVSSIGKDKIIDTLHFVEHYHCNSCGCKFDRKINCELEVTDPGFEVDESLEGTVAQDLSDNRQPKQEKQELEYEEPVNNDNKMRKHEKAIEEDLDTIDKIDVKQALKRVYNNDFEEEMRLAKLIGIENPASLEKFISQEGLIDEEPIDTLKRYINATFGETGLTETINLELSTSANPEDYFDDTVKPGNRPTSQRQNVTAFIDVSGSQCTETQIDAALKIAKQYGANNILFFAQRLGSINPYDYKNSKNNLFDMYGGGTDYTEVIKYIQSHADEKAVIITDDDIFYCPGISKPSAAADLVGHPDTVVCIRDDYRNPLHFNELNKYDSRIKW